MKFIGIVLILIIFSSCGLNYSSGSLGTGFFYDTNKDIFFDIMGVDAYGFDQKNNTYKTKRKYYILEAGTKDKRFNKEKIDSLKNEYGYFTLDENFHEFWVEANNEDCKWFAKRFNYDSKDRISCLGKYIYLDFGISTDGSFFDYYGCHTPLNSNIEIKHTSKKDTIVEWVGLLEEKKDGEFGEFCITKILSYKMYKEYGKEKYIFNELNEGDIFHENKDWYSDENGEDVYLLHQFKVPSLEQINESLDFNSMRLYRVFPVKPTL